MIKLKWEYGSTYYSEDWQLPLLPVGSNVTINRKEYVVIFMLKVTRISAYQSDTESDVAMICEVITVT